VSDKGAIYAAMAAVMKDVEAVTKGRTNTQQNYKFRGIDDMYNALHGILAKHGVFTIPSVVDIQRTERESKSGGLLTVTLAKVQYRFYATDGSYVDALTAGEGMDSGDKSCNKALAGAHKYALVQSFAIPTESGDDSENDNPEPKPEPKPSAKKEPAKTERTPVQVLYYAIIDTLKDAEATGALKHEAAKAYQKEMNVSIAEGGDKAMAELEGVRKRVAALIAGRLNGEMAQQAELDAAAEAGFVAPHADGYTP